MHRSLRDEFALLVTPSGNIATETIAVTASGNIAPDAINWCHGPLVRGRTTWYVFGTDRFWYFSRVK